MHIRIIMCYFLLASSIVPRDRCTVAVMSSLYHEPPDKRLMVVAFADSSEAICTVHPTPCKHAFCRSYWINYGIVQITGSKYTHCELYWPHNQLSISVDSIKNVHCNKSRTYLTDIGRWEFLYLLVTREQERLITKYVTMQKGRPYDNTSFYLFGILSCTSCFQPRARPIQYYSNTSLSDVDLQSKLPPAETCARLLMGAFVYADLVPPQDVRLATPHSVYEALINIGAQSTYALPVLPEIEQTRELSIFELAKGQSDTRSYSTESMHYALSGGFAPTSIGDLNRTSRPLLTHEHGGHGYEPLETYESQSAYWKAIGVESQKNSRFASLS